MITLLDICTVISYLLTCIMKDARLSRGMLYFINLRQTLKQVETFYYNIHFTETIQNENLISSN